MAVERDQPERVFTPADWPTWVPNVNFMTEGMTGYRAHYRAEQWINPDRELLLKSLGAIKYMLEVEGTRGAPSMTYTYYANGAIEYWEDYRTRQEQLLRPDDTRIDLMILRRFEGQPYELDIDGPNENKPASLIR